jgi:arylsulfatase A-like enzyme
MISMDWLPTLLAATGLHPDPAYPPDGEDLVPTLIGRASQRPRKLFWRYKAGGQRAVRDSD